MYSFALNSNRHLYFNLLHVEDVVFSISLMFFVSIQPTRNSSDGSIDSLQLSPAIPMLNISTWLTSWVMDGLKLYLFVQKLSPSQKPEPKKKPNKKTTQRKSQPKILRGTKSQQPWLNSFLYPPRWHVTMPELSWMMVPFWQFVYPPRKTTWPPENWWLGRCNVLLRWSFFGEKMSIL